MRIGNLRSESWETVIGTAIGFLVAGLFALVFRQWLVLSIGIGGTIVSQLSSRNVRPRVWWYALFVAVAAMGLVVLWGVRSTLGRDLGFMLLCGGIVGFVGIGMLRLVHNPAARV